VKVAKGRLKQLIREEMHKIQEGFSMPDIQAVIDGGHETMDLVELVNEMGALVAQNHYRLTLKYDMDSMNLAGDIITEFEKDLIPYMNDYFGGEADLNHKLGKTLDWLDKAIRDELGGQNVY
jgi:hypothetical protein